MLADARYLHQELSNLKELGAGGRPIANAMLETVVSEKRVVSNVVPPPSVPRPASPAVSETAANSGGFGGIGLGRRPSPFAAVAQRRASQLSVTSERGPSSPAPRTSISGAPEQPTVSEIASSSTASLGSMMARSLSASVSGFSSTTSLATTLDNSKRRASDVLPPTPTTPSITTTPPAPAPHTDSTAPDVPSPPLPPSPGPPPPPEKEPPTPTASTWSRLSRGFREVIERELPHPHLHAPSQSQSHPPEPEPVVPTATPIPIPTPPTASVPVAAATTPPAAEPQSKPTIIVAETEPHIANPEPELAPQVPVSVPSLTTVAEPEDQASESEAESETESDSEADDSEEEEEMNLDSEETPQLPPPIVPAKDEPAVPVAPVTLPSAPNHSKPAGGESAMDASEQRGGDSGGGDAGGSS